jgi:pimeloyl-ACP methyl ester carboxylesterase
MSPEQIIAAVTALMLSTENPDFDHLRSGGHDTRYPVTVSACDFPPAPFEVEGKTILCGTVDVPEDYDKPQGRRVGLKFALFDALTQSPSPDPLVYLHGGPAGGTLHMIDAVATAAFPKHRLTRDIVTFDQRGAALSAGSVSCTNGLADHILNLALAKRESPASENAYLAELVSPCVEEIKASGADLSAYNTENNARDVQALMSALGYGTYNVYGISYGTRLALEVMRTVPQGVRSVVIDGVAPSFVPILDTFATPFADSMDKLAEQCATDEACHAAYPDIAASFNAAFKKLGTDPIPGGPKDQVLDDGALYHTVFELRNKWRLQYEITPYLPRIFAEAMEGKRDAYDAMVAGFNKKADPKAGLGTADLSADERALAASALDMASTMQSLSEASDAVVTQLRSDVQAAVRSASVAEAFDRRASQALREMTDRKSAARFMTEYTMMRSGEPSKKALADFVSNNFSGVDKADLLALVSAMKPEDVERTFRIAAQTTKKYEIAVAKAVGFDIYICQESSNSLEGFDRVTKKIAERYSIFGDPYFRTAATGTLDQCAYFEKFPRKGFMDPVVSNIPTLVLNGTLDTQTSMHWGALAAKTLSNARNYIIPEAGHGTIIYQSCARDIAAAFTNDPNAELNVSCIDTLQPKFILPDDPLP